MGQFTKEAPVTAARGTDGRGRQGIAATPGRTWVVPPPSSRPTSSALIRDRVFGDHGQLPGYRRARFHRDIQGRESRSRQSTKAVGFDVDPPSPILATREAGHAFLVNRKGDRALASAHRAVLGFAWLVNTAGDGDQDRRSSNRDFSTLQARSRISIVHQ